MKQLKITINDEVKTFDLPENGEYKCEVTESYVPKMGDCVMVKRKEDNISFWCKLTDVTNEAVAFRILVDSNLKICSNRFFYIGNRIYTKITPEELKAKYAEAGYDWDYETDTIKPIKWVPKYGDTVWFMDSLLNTKSFIFRGDYDIFIKSFLDKGLLFQKSFLEKGLLFPTEEECQKFADHCWEFINNK